MATLVIRNPDGSEQEQDVASQITIGRSEGNDLILSEGGVSRKHARFFLDDDGMYVEDVGSANGTWVDGERIENAVKLSAESQVVVGDYEISVKLPVPSGKRQAVRGSSAGLAKGGRGAPAARGTKVVPAIKPSTVKKAGSGRAASPQLRGLTGGVTGKVFALSGTKVVGRVAGTDITIDDDSVSRRHAELIARGKEVIVRDLGSANGTTVNGVAISEDTTLSPGDIIQFGVVEVMFETSTPSGSRAPVRRPAPGSGPSSRRPPIRYSEDQLNAVDDHAPMDPAKKRKLIIGGAAGLVFLALIILKAFTTHETVNQNATPLGNGGRSSGKKPVSADPADEIEGLLTECRTYSSPDLGKPDWSRAEIACQKIIEIEPIHADANLLLKKIKTERACEDNLEKGKELVIAGKFEESLDFFAKVGAHTGDCPTYFLRAMSAARDPVSEVKRLAGKECKDYSTNGKWENAYKRCEVYIRLACQMMEPKDLYPPALTKLKLDGPIGKGDWRPADPLYIDFLKAREKVKPGEPPWQCPELRAFRPPPPPVDLAKLAKDEFMGRYPDKEMGRALVMYFDGKTEARVPLLKILEAMSKANEHELARKLLQDITEAQNLLDNGASELSNDKPEKAAIPFRRALEVDERLVLGDRLKQLSDDEKRRELEKRTSYVRRTIIESMSSKCYERGKFSADRKDFKLACQVWKLGDTFGRTNTDLVKALTNVCTRRAEEILAHDPSCAQLQQALEFAVDGDGFKQQINQRLEQDGCSSP